MEIQGEFVDDGTETHFEIDDVGCCVKTTSSGKRTTGVIHRLFLEDNEIPPFSEGT